MQQIRQLLNSGYKAGMPGIRLIGEDMKPQAFDVYSPKILAAIQWLEDILASRCIAIPMRRTDKKMPCFPPDFDGSSIRHQLYTLALTHFGKVYANYFGSGDAGRDDRRDARARPTTNPNEIWVNQQARQIVWQFGERTHPIRFLLRDRDSKFTPAFDSIFASEGIHVIQTPYRAPNANAYAERWVRSIREECLSKLLIVNEAHLRSVMRDYVTYYNTARPHQGIVQLTPIPRPPAISTGKVRRREILGGVIGDYYQDTA
jgi:hypothetical protein